MTKLSSYERLKGINPEEYMEGLIKRFSEHSGLKLEYSVAGRVLTIKQPGEKRGRLVVGLEWDGDAFLHEHHGRLEAFGITHDEERIMVRLIKLHIARRLANRKKTY
jgi:hypothetical protein